MKRALSLVLSDDELFDDAIASESAADEDDARASENRWRAADDYYELSGREYSNRAIAKRAKKSPAHIDYCIKAVTANPGWRPRPPFQDAYRKAQGKSVHYSSGTPEWETPQDLFDELDREFGFTLDVCATPELAKCERYFSPDDDGLAQEWAGTCWMNPPYGDEISSWVEKAYESRSLATVVCLVPARVDTGWWWDYCRKGDVRFLRGRLRFGGAKASAPFPSAVVVFPGSGGTLYWERAA